MFVKDMKNRLIYVELKSGHSDNGPAWIGLATTSKSGATIYSNGKAFQSSKGSGIGGNYFDIESGEDYWISGVKKNNADRHWAGSGQVLIDQDAISAYLSETGQSSLPPNLTLVHLLPATQQPHHQDLEHRPLGKRSSE
ncbi:hypothetical protein [Robiginitomaculum antarcticum]|uniref:hypothetical protein n=1 Tax=Robiginitomaculum antarcticum TaxID=437507 RepID=UPI00035CAEE1|nr:hypothetical protein [Robiginitomaculum antarcticum]